jgi:3-hydroxy-5-methyl-1-naphthoate 3-O-methyltransferase
VYAPRVLSSHEFFLRMMTGYRSTKVLLVSNRIGVFEKLEQRSLSAEELADELACDRRATAILLDALVSLELVHAHDARFSNTQLASRHLVRGKPDYVGDNLVFQDMLWECWSNLESVVRTGKPYRSLPQLLADRDSSFTESYIRGMIPISRPAAEEIARLFDGRPLARMLDVGCGPGVYSQALLHRQPSLRATMLDLPSTLEVTRWLVAEDPAAARMELRPGDYVRDEYGSNYDLILMSHVTHDESETVVQDMLAKAHRALAPGGVVAIHDWVVGEDDQPSAFAPLFSINLMVYSTGRLYSRAAYLEMLRRVGFGEIEVRRVLAGKVSNPTVLITGRKTCGAARAKETAVADDDKPQLQEMLHAIRTSLAAIYCTLDLIPRSNNDISDAIDDGRRAARRIQTLVEAIESSTPPPDPSAEAHAAQPPTRVQPDPRKHRVMVIDDDETIGYSIRRALKPDFEVQSFVDGREALVAIESGADFDVILCDMVMPEISGIDVHAHLARRNPSLADRIVFLTGGAFSAAAKKFIAGIPNLQVLKPFRMEELRRVIFEVLATRPAR